MGRLVGRIGNNGLCFGKCLRYLVVHLVKGNAVVDISGRYHCLKHETVAIAGRMGLIRKLPLMAALYEQATVRVGHAFRDYMRFIFLSPRQFLLGCVISAFFRWLWRLIVVFKRLLPMSFPVCVDFLHQFLRVVLGRHRHLLFYLLLCIGICLNMGAVYEDCLRGQISRFRHLFQYPRKDLVHGFCGKAVSEIITHRGKMRRFLLQRISKEPTVADICADLIRCPPQGRQAVQMLDQNHLEQHNRVHTWPPVILAVQWFHHFIEPVKIYRRIYFSQQMVFRHQAFCIHDFYDTTIHFSAFQHLSSPRTILSYKRKKAQPLLDFFDRLTADVKITSAV